MKEYFIIVSPPEQIQKSINFYKDLYKRNFGDATFLKSKGHISLNKFEMLEEREIFLKRDLNLYFNSFKSFVVQINSFNRFEGSNTLYMQVSKDQLINLSRHLVTVLRSQVKLNAKHAKMISAPHLTIAKLNSLNDLNRSWNLFKDEKFEDTFLVNRLVVLKRPAKSLHKWQLAFEVCFKEPPRFSPPIHST